MSRLSEALERAEKFYNDNGLRLKIEFEAGVADPTEMAKYRAAQELIRGDYAPAPDARMCELAPHMQRNVSLFDA